MLNRGNAHGFLGVAREVVEDGVVGFGGSGGEDDVEGAATKMGGDFVAGFGEGDFGAGAEAVRAGWVGGKFFGGGEPGFFRDGGERRSGVVVEIDQSR